jgi:hypothetical protein
LQARVKILIGNYSRQGHIIVEAPFGRKILFQRLLRQDRPDHFHRHGIEVHDGVMILLIAHLTAVDHFFFQGIELPPSGEIGQLI